MMNKLISILSLILLFSCEPETNDEESDENNHFSEEQMLEDYLIFQSIYESANSGLYRHRTKNQIDSIFLLNKNLISTCKSYREYYNILSNVISYTGGCHNFIDFPDSLDMALKEQNIYFPIPLKYIENKIYTNLDFENIPVGSQLISINGIEARAFAFQITKNVVTDGNNETGKYADIETSWLPLDIYFAMGKQKYFDIEYISNNSIINKKRIQSITFKEFDENYEKRFSKNLEERNSESYSYQYLDSINIGLLNVTTFMIGGPKSKEYEDFRIFLDSVCNNLKANHVNNLIIDIRSNDGGYSPNELLLYSCFTKRTFKENKTAFTIFNDVPHNEYYFEEYSGEIVEFEDDLKEKHNNLRDGRYYQDSIDNPLWNPHDNAFTGKVFLLINPLVASAGSHFASMIKSDKNTVVIGEETLGGYYGHTGHYPICYQLPNSKFILTFSIVDLEQDVEKLDDEEYGDGVKPDFKVSQSYQDFLHNKDTQLNYAIEKATTLNEQ